jgi:diguanylate cyclase (GGDEF)-like protein
LRSYWTRSIERFEQKASFAPKTVAAVGLATIALIGFVDFATGVEVRTYPLYFLPVSLIAWFLGRRAAALTAVLCAVSWVASNYLAGLEYSSRWIWVFNLAMQGTSFMLVGQLIASVRASLAREIVHSRIDPLTLLLNRRAFYEMAQQILELGGRYHHPLTIAYIDLDNFKAVNDTLGHEHGDRMLQKAAQSLRRSVRAGDVCARLGGDEFVVLLPETAAAGAETLLERLRASMAGELADASCAASVSIGAVSFITPPATVEDLVRQADAAMYEAKAAGKNRLSLRTVALEPAAT